MGLWHRNSSEFTHVSVFIAGPKPPFLCSDLPFSSPWGPPKLVPTVWEIICFALWAAVHSGCNCTSLNGCQVSLFNLLLLCLLWCILLQESYLSATHPRHEGSKAKQNNTHDVFLVRQSQAVAVISHVPCLHSNCYYLYPLPPGRQVRLLSDALDLHKRLAH